MPTTIFFKEQKNLPLFLPLFFGFGAAFFFLFPENFSANLFVFVALLVTAGILYFWQRAFIYLLCASFLLGSFYAKIYPKPKTLTGKIFVEVVGKVESVKKFSNPVNGVEGMNLVVSELKLSKVNSFSKKKNKAKKPRKISAKKIEKDFVNLEGYQEIDRQFLDHSKSYQASIPKDFKRISVSLSKNLTPPQFVPSRHCEPSSNWRDNPSLVTDEWIASSTARSDEEVDCVGVGSKSSNEISVNDKITFRALLQPPKQQEFP
ncbi:MAG: hypothetical protein FJX34_06015, partial [Alphaproteobacteria bacterium]|nr:hypothetical protein [Alphaproteobacteria bacterium]